MKFYLGTHVPAWLGKTDIPLFISHRTLKNRKTMPQAQGPWALDSGGFTELSTYGKWETSPQTYIDAVHRYQQAGNLDWVAPQDWMCEPWIIAKTGLTVLEHQKRTVDNYLHLHQHLGDLVIPVLQGWNLDDYQRCIQLYNDNGIDLTTKHTVGLGSVCRRQATNEIGTIVTKLAGYGIKMHGFGVKRQGIQQYGWQLTSADSMAWSFGGRRIHPCPQRPVKTCANCWHHAIEWREKVLTTIPQPVQPSLF